MPRCTCCGKEAKLVKEWDLSSKVHVKMYECCGKKIREYLKVTHDHEEKD